MREGKMKRVVSLALVLALVLTMFGCSAPSGDASTGGGDVDKKAILLVSFGTSYNDTREVTLDAALEDYKAEFSGYDVYRAFTAQIIIDKLKERDDMDVMNVSEAFEMLKKEGYGTVLVQSLHVMNGAEYHEIIKAAIPYGNAFKDLKFGWAMLTSHEDYVAAAEAMATTFPEMNEGEAVVLMGHGTHHHANAVYACFEKTFHTMGYDNVFVGTVEGFPTLDDVVKELEKNNIKKVTLMPMMMVAGDHASNDMAGDEEDSWKVMLKQKGYEVDIYLHGMGEIKAIRDLFIKHTEEMIAREPNAWE